MEGYYFTFNLDQCVGCHACQVACQVYNGTQAFGTWRQIYYPDDDAVPAIPLSMACNHCMEAPCLIQCPTRAIYRDDQTGAVLIDEDKCIGCAYCVWNCPYEAPVINGQKGVMEKCHFCNERLLDGLDPACVALCPTDALGLEKGKMVPETALLPVKTEPGGRIQMQVQDENSKVKSNRWYVPDPLPDLQGISGKSAPSMSIRFPEEWPLWIFTLVISIIVPLSSVEFVGRVPVIIPLLFLVAGLLASGFSLFHLGKPFRAWRAIANVRNSWISREILFLGLFLTGLVIQLFFAVPGYVHLITGMPLVFAIDRVYRPVQWHWKIPVHSGQSWMIFISTLCLVSDQPWYFLIIAVLRFFLLLNQPDGSGLRLITVIRTLLLTGTSVLIFIDVGLLIVFPVFLVGEAMDRYLFYTQLRVQPVSRHLSNFLTMINPVKD